jgi:integrase/recombinase XerD
VVPSGSGRESGRNDLLTPEEVRRLLEACSVRSSTGLRNRALITVMYRCGLRVAEVIALPSRNVDREDGTIRVARPNRHRIVALDGASFRVLDAWLARRRELALDARCPLFCTLQGGTISPSYLRALFARLGRKARLDKRVSAEVLRRTLAAELAREGVPIGLIQAQLGHGSPATTQRYLTRVAPDGLAEAMRRRDGWLT